MLPALDLAGVVRITRLITHSRSLAILARRQPYNATILQVGIGGRTATESLKTDTAAVVEADSRKRR